MKGSVTERPKDSPPGTKGEYLDRMERTCTSGASGSLTAWVTVMGGSTPRATSQSGETRSTRPEDKRPASTGETARTPLASTCQPEPGASRCSPRSRRSATDADSDYRRRSTQQLRAACSPRCSTRHSSGLTARRDDFSGILETLEAGAVEPPPNLLPQAAVDERSIACVVCRPQTADEDFEPVVRRFLSDVARQHQAALLDVDAYQYLESIDYELAARPSGLKRILDEIGPAYAESHLKHEKRPRTFVLRPIRIACQNVIVGLAAVAQEASIDGLAVLAWQTCEVPHVATHEANRALAVITLCDAFQNGGTMEVRFDHPATLNVDGKKVRYAGHPEGAVPASLRRFARTVGVQLGAEEPASISPREARELFRAITPMPDELRERVDTAVASAGIKPERLYYSLLKPISACHRARLATGRLIPNSLDLGRRRGLGSALGSPGGGRGLPECRHGGNVLPTYQRD